MCPLFLHCKRISVWKTDIFSFFPTICSVNCCRFVPSVETRKVKLGQKYWWHWNVDLGFLVHLLTKDLSRWKLMFALTCILHQSGKWFIISMDEQNVNGGWGGRRRSNTLSMIQCWNVICYLIWSIFQLCSEYSPKALIFPTFSLCSL